MALVCRICGQEEGQAHHPSCKYNLVNDGLLLDTEYEKAGKARKASEDDRIFPVEEEVPYDVQAWMYDALAHTMIHELSQYICSVHEEKILACAKDRFNEGYKTYGSEMYNWSPEVRFKNVMEELADAVVYMTSGPLPIPDEIPD